MEYDANVCKMVLGRDLGLEHVVGMSLATLVGKFNYNSMNKYGIEAWVEATWNPMFGYCSEVCILSKGWYGFTFNHLEHAIEVLERACLKGAA